MSVRRAVRALLGALLLPLAMAACERPRMNDAEAAALTRGGDARRGAALLRRHGCTSCHSVGGVPGANSLVGPPLDGVGGRTYVAGVLPNTPDNLVRWIVDPRGVDSLTAMPDVGVTDAQARDIAAYLYTLR